MIDLSSFKLLKEDEKHYELSHPNGRSFKFEKKGMSEKAHALLKKLEKQGVQKFDDGGEVQPDPITTTPTTAPITLGTPTTPAAAPESSGGSEFNVAPTQSGTPAEQKMSIADKGFEAEKIAEQEKIKAAQMGAAGESRAIKDVQGQIEAMPTQQEILNSYKQKDDQLLASFQNQKIDPDRYMHNMGTGSRIAAGIGLILGGVGAGLTHGRNMAAEMLESAINRDIDAQKNDQSKSMNLWKMNREALGNDMAANLATQNQLYTGLKYKIMQATANSNSQMAKANGDQALALIQQKQDSNNQQLYFMKEGMGQSPGMTMKQDPSVLVPMLVKDPGQQRLVFDEIQRAQNTAKAKDEILKSFDKAAQETRPMTGGIGAAKNIVPGYKAPHVLALHAGLAPTMQDIEGTARPAMMDRLNEEVTPALGDSDEKIAVKRAALVNHLQAKSSAPVAKGYGIDLSKFSSTNTAGPGFSPGSVVSVKGKQYTVGQDGNTLTPVK